MHNTVIMSSFKGSRKIDWEIEIPEKLKKEEFEIILSKDGKRLQISDLQIVFNKTLRIPQDGKKYPLPPSLGQFKLYRVEDYKDRVPKKWLKDGGLFFPMLQKEAMWMEFEIDKRESVCACERRCFKRIPKALKVATGMINSVSGKPWKDQLDQQNQDYLVIPDQKWLDGVNSGGTYINQFVAMPLGAGTSVEQQITGEDKFGGIQLLMYDSVKTSQWSTKITQCPHKGFLYDVPRTLEGGVEFKQKKFSMVKEQEYAPFPEFPMYYKSRESSPQEMSLSVGGIMAQKIEKDIYGYDNWDQTKYARVFIHIVNSEMFKEITGMSPPYSEVSAEIYTQYGYPWFYYYDETIPSIPKSNILGKLKTISDIQGTTTEESSFMVPKVIHIHKDPEDVFFFPKY